MLRLFFGFCLAWLPLNAALAQGFEDLERLQALAERNCGAFNTYIKENNITSEGGGAVGVYGFMKKVIGAEGEMEITLRDSQSLLLEIENSKVPLAVCKEGYMAMWCKAAFDQPSVCPSSAPHGENGVGEVEIPAGTIPVALQLSLFRQNPDDNIYEVLVDASKAPPGKYFLIVVDSGDYVWPQTYGDFDRSSTSRHRFRWPVGKISSYPLSVFYVKSTNREISKIRAAAADYMHYIDDVGKMDVVSRVCQISEDNEISRDCQAN